MRFGLFCAPQASTATQGPETGAGFHEWLDFNVEAERLHFTTDLAAAVKPADVVYLAVGTPQGADGAANLSALWSVVESLAPGPDPALPEGG